ncbi:MAG: ATP-binding protein [Acidobacteria bacterium]|nr:ATP-binding protein [Acidobacteriota bacterium]
MQRRILIIDDHDDLATSLDEVFTKVGHEVTVVETRKEALALDGMETYDVVITDLNIDNRTELLDEKDAPVCLPHVETVTDHESLKAFKICAANYRRDDFNEDELKNLVATTLDYKIRYVDTYETVKEMRESIEFELPSAISLMHIVLEYLLKRVEKLGAVDPEQTNLFTALDEAFVNAVKHGNKYDSRKLVRIVAEISKKEARFTIEDEGEGFDVNSIPDPLDPQNLFKTSGRGVLFIYNIMDEVAYNERGNRLTMVKRSQSERLQ